mmetsp:Transcript_14447/g.25409  ORF Transcript_14447/g.25409 Transcript_14447/m.25409 type:complete len:133 (-) Transcript_14447:84-482(-)
MSPCPRGWLGLVCVSAVLVDAYQVPKSDIARLRPVQLVTENSTGTLPGKDGEPLTLTLSDTENVVEKAMEDCAYFLGLQKFTWAILCDILALVVILLCIPLLLTCSKRRPVGAPMFECGWICGPDGSLLFKA